MQNNPAEEWQQLSQNYREKFDGELEDLALDMGDLTETAREVLRNEMKNRGLAMPGEKAEAGTRPERSGTRVSSSVDPDAEFDASNGAGSDEGANSPHEYTWKTPLCECNSSEEAWQITQVLKRAGIDSWVSGANSGMGGYPKVLVGADQLEEAIQLTSQPIPQDILEDSNREVPEYVPPTCPKCGAEDPVLESAEPTNSWLCEACGAEWTDPEPGSDDQPA